MHIMLLISLDNLSFRYGCLPSEALARATTFDLSVLHVSSQWQNYNANGGTDESKKVKYNSQNHGLSTEDMLAMQARAKEQQDAN